MYSSSSNSYSYTVTQPLIILLSINNLLFLRESLVVICSSFNISIIFQTACTQSLVGYIYDEVF